MAESIHKETAYEGSRWDESTQSVHKSGVKRVIVKDLTDGVDGAALKAAADKAKADFATWNGLPVLTAVASNLGGDPATAQVLLGYRQPQALVDLTVAAKDQTQAFNSTDTIQWWSRAGSGGQDVDSLGRPNGQPFFRPPGFDAGGPLDLFPYPWSWQFGTTTYFLNTVLADATWQATTPPAVNLDRKSGHANSNAVAFITKGRSFPANTVVFRGYRATTLHNGFWLVQYVFVHNPFQWVLQMPPTRVFTGNTVVWLNGPLNHRYGMVNMLATDFPVHS